MVSSELPATRKDNVKYYENRHPYLSDPNQRPKFLSGGATNSFEVNDRNFHSHSLLHQSRTKQQQRPPLFEWKSRSIQGKSKPRQPFYSLLSKER